MKLTTLLQGPVTKRVDANHNSTTLKGIIAAALFAFGVGVPAASGDTPTYRVEAMLPAWACTTVDMSPDGTKLYARVHIADWDEGYRQFDTSTYQILNNAQNPQCRISNDVSWVGRVSADGTSMWTSRYYAGTVVNLDLATNPCVLLNTVSVGSWPDDLLFDDDKQYLYVGENDPGTGAIGSIQVVDTWGDPPAVVCSVTLNGEPGRLAKAPGDPFVYVTSRNSGTETLFKVDTSTIPTCPTDPPTLALPGIGDVGISVSPDGTRIFVPHPSMNIVYVVNATSMTVEDTFAVPSPLGFFVAPTGDHAIVTQGSLGLSVFDLVAEIVVQEIDWRPDGGSKWMPRWTVDNQKVFVPSSHGVIVLAVEEPAGDVPSVSEWGWAVLTLLLFMAGTILFRYRRAAVV